MIKKLNRSNLSVDAYATLRELFTQSERYGPGDKISIEELANELGVSRTPLWGAIYRLESEGIVEIVPRSGVYLIKYDPGRLIDIYYAREALEGMVAKLAAKRITESEIGVLKANIDLQRRHLKKEELDAYHAVVIEFHELLAKFARNVTLNRLLAAIYAQIKAMRVQRNQLPPMRLPQSCDEHETLARALMDRDPDRAEKLARRHIADLRKQIEDQQGKANSTAPSNRKTRARTVRSPATSGL